jgi:hypothetical protein
VSSFFSLSIFLCGGCSMVAYQEYPFAVTYIVAIKINTYEDIHVQTAVYYLVETLYPSS